MNEDNLNQHKLCRFQYDKILQISSNLTKISETLLTYPRILFFISFIKNFKKKYFKKFFVIG